MHKCTINEDKGKKTIYVLGGLFHLSPNVELYSSSYKTSIETMVLSENEWKLSSARVPEPLDNLQVVASRSPQYSIYMTGWYTRDLSNTSKPKKIFGLKRKEQKWKEVGQIHDRTGFSTINVGFSETCKLL